MLNVNSGSYLRLTKMAVVTTTLDPAPVRFPYINPYGQPLQWQTGIPREELVFSVVAEDIPIAAGGNTQRLVLNNILPPVDAYVLVEAKFAIDGVDFADWSTEAFSNLVSERLVTPVWSILLRCPGVDTLEGPSTGRVTFESQVSNKVLLSADAGGGQLRFKVDNNTADGAAMNVTSFVRFLVFERNQASQWSVNTPQPTR